MKIKDITPNMAIHCKTEHNAVLLLEHLYQQGCKTARDRMADWQLYKENTCYQVYMSGSNIRITYGPMSSYKKDGHRIVEFSDLVEESSALPFSFHTISSGMVIECETKMEAFLLLRHLSFLGYCSDTGADISGWAPKAGDYLITHMGDYKFVGWKESWDDSFCGKDTYDVIKFSDLIVWDSPTDSPIQEKSDVLISRNELLRQFREYTNKTFSGEATADTELRIGEIASIIMACPAATETIPAMPEKYKDSTTEEKGRIPAMCRILGVEVGEVWAVNSKRYPDGAFSYRVNVDGKLQYYSFGKWTFVNDNRLINRLTAHPDRIQHMQQEPEEIESPEWVNICRVFVSEDGTEKCVGTQEIDGEDCEAEAEGILMQYRTESGDCYAEVSRRCRYRKG